MKLSRAIIFEIYLLCCRKVFNQVFQLRDEVRIFLSDKIYFHFRKYLIDFSWLRKNKNTVINTC